MKVKLDRSENGKRWRRTEAHKILIVYVAGWDKIARKKFLQVCARAFWGDEFYGTRAGLEKIARGGVKMRLIGNKRRRVIADALGISVDLGIGHELVFLRRTIGSAPWLDNLENEQWRVLAEEIMPVYHRALALRSIAPGVEIYINGEVATKEQMGHVVRDLLRGTTETKG